MTKIDKKEIVDWLRLALYYLDNQSQNYGRDWSDLKVVFFCRFQRGYIFSTRLGANFFKEILERIENNRPLEPEEGKMLGEYDIYFNKWLKLIE